MQVSKNAVVTIDYTLQDDQGQVIDSSKGGQALSYLHGSGVLLPGLESALDGKVEGDEVKVRLDAENGYGVRDERLVQVVPRTSFEAGTQIEPGMQVQASDGQNVRVLTVVAVAEENVTLDANHPLAGVNLEFEVAVRGVRAATEEELQHGHSHGPGGHAH